jgi:hypothetical protein
MLFPRFIVTGVCTPEWFSHPDFPFDSILFFLSFCKETAVIHTGFGSILGFYRDSP